MVFPSTAHGLTRHFRQLLMLLPWLMPVSWCGAGPSSPAALMQLRLEPVNLKATVVEQFQGQPLPVRVELANPTAQPQAASLGLDSRRLYPFSPVIPPYVGAEARTFTVKLYVESTQGAAPAMKWVLERLGAVSLELPVPPARQLPGQWHDLELTDPALGSADHPVSHVVLQAAVPPGGQAVFYLAVPTLVTAAGQPYAILNAEVPMMLAGMKKPLADRPLRELPKRESLTLGGYVIDQPDWVRDIPAMTQFMNARFPDADFVIAPVWTPATPAAAVLAQLPAGVFFQFQKAQADTRFPAALDALPKNPEGRPLPDFGNSVLATHPVIIQGLKDEVDFAASLGVNNFKQVDYNWPWHNYHMGYDAASVAAFRDDLAGRDDGLLLLPGPGGAKAGIIHFWDYFADNHGLRFSPADLGFASWDAFQPVSGGQAADGTARDKRNFSVATALVHYEWLRQAQRFGRWAKAHGGKHDYTLNPEDVGNGGDYVYLLRLADAGLPYFEFFGGPAIVRAAYSHLPTYLRAAQAAGRTFGVITEIGMGGHGQNYWDPEVGYLVLYELGALGASHYHNEWMESPWSVMSDPKHAYHYDRYSAWVSQADGWRQARREGTFRPAPKVVSVSLRSSVHYMQAWLWNVQQADSLGAALADANIDYEETDTLELPDVLDRADVVFYTPPVSQPVDGARIQAWLARGGKTLVTHSYIPVSRDNGEVKLLPGVKNVEFRGEEFDCADFLDLTQGTGGESSLHPAFAGLAKEAQGYWRLPGMAAQWPDATPATSPWKQVKLGNGLEWVCPMVSELTLPGNSRILYIHRRPRDLAPKQLEKLMAVLTDHCSLPRLAVPDPMLGGPVIAHRFQPPGDTRVMVLWNVRHLLKLGDTGGYGSHLLPERGPDKFDLNRRPYPILAPGERCGAQVPVARPGVYRVYRFLEDRDELLTAGADCRLPLVVAGRFAEQFYYAPDTPAFRDEVARLRLHRAKVGPFFSRPPPGT